MKQSGRIVSALAGALVAWVAAPLAAQDVAAALQAIDEGRPAQARAVLGSEIARLSFYQALAEEGEARTTAATRARDLAREGSWVRSAASALLADGADDLAGAVSGYEAATSVAPDDARLWYLLGESRRKADDAAGSRAAYERTTALDPSHRPALIRLGDALRAENDLGSAYNAYNHAIDDATAPVGALLGRAATRLFMGDAAGSLVDLERAATAAEPGTDLYRALMGSLYVRAYERNVTEGLDRAEAAARMWADLGRSDMIAATMNAAGRVLLETGDPDSAAQWYERGWQAVEASSLAAEERTIWRVRWLHGRARCAAAKRETESAAALAAEARTLMASDEANREHYDWIEPYLNGYLALSARRSDTAIAQLLLSDLERPYIRMLLADAYARKRDRANARLWYERALAAATQLDAESVIVRPLATAWLARNQ